MAFEKHNEDADDFGIDVLIITKNMCPNCNATKNFLDRLHIPYRTINAETDETIIDEFGDKTALEYVKRDGGMVQMPYVQVTDPDEIYTQTWNGARPDLLRNLKKLFATKRTAKTADELKD